MPMGCSVLFTSSDRDQAAIVELLPAAGAENESIEKE